MPFLPLLAVIGLSLDAWSASGYTLKCRSLVLSPGTQLRLTVATAAIYDSDEEVRLVRKNKPNIIISDLHQLEGHVTVLTGAAALEFVRLDSNPFFYTAFQPSAPVTEATTLSPGLEMNFGLPDFQSKRLRRWVKYSDPFFPSVTTNGFFPEDVLPQLGVLPPKVCKADDGFIVQRTLLVHCRPYTVLQRSFLMEVREFVGKRGAFSREIVRFRPFVELAARWSDTSALRALDPGIHDGAFHTKSSDFYIQWFLQNCLELGGSPRQAEKVREEILGIAAMMGEWEPIKIVRLAAFLQPGDSPYLVSALAMLPATQFEGLLVLTQHPSRAVLRNVVQALQSACDRASAAGRTDSGLYSRAVSRLEALRLEEPSLFDPPIAVVDADGEN